MTPISQPTLLNQLLPSHKIARGFICTVRLETWSKGWVWWIFWSAVVPEGPYRWTSSAGLAALTATARLFSATSETQEQSLLSV